MDPRPRRRVKRLIADIPEDLHNQVKAQAAFKNMSLTRYIMQALFEKLAKDKQYQ